MRGLRDALRRYQAEALVSLAVLFGWALFTAGLSGLLDGVTVRWVSLEVGAADVWGISAGLFLLSLAGWRWLVRQLFTHGLYTLSRGREQ